MTDNINYNHIVDYLNKTLPDTKGKLWEMEQYAHENNVPIIQKEVRCFLGTLLRLKNPKTIVELGTAIGYSSLFFSDYIQDGGKIITHEREQDYYDIAMANIKAAGKEDKIQIVFGDAFENVKKLNGSYDMIFMDANKSMYRYYLDTLFPYLKVGGIIVCDNILYKGMISNDDLAPRKQNTIISNIRGFLDYISHHPKLETSIIPIGDGVSVSVKLSD
ncbi:MAG: O-methyltransferase [Ruminococcaceae bacterium]|nr:O-methyltransferase [Oscillospiraceae bacterium]